MKINNDIVLAEGENPYEIHVGVGKLALLGKLTRARFPEARRAVLVTDRTVDRLYTDDAVMALVQSGFTVVNFLFAAGEEQKNLDTVKRMYDKFSDAKLTRGDIVVALGGGVVGDMAGFAAATYLRGIEYVGVPTTLLAQVDSSVGGKTSVNIAAGKNLVGAFKKPALVVCDTVVIRTLDKADYLNGLGEIIKYGMIADRELFDLCKNNDLSVHKELMPEIIKRCIAIKADITERDFTEQNVRKCLNFGHTFGHAIEKMKGYGNIRHGAAVAAGMSLLCKLFSPKTVAEELDEVLEKYHLPIARVHKEKVNFERNGILILETFLSELKAEAMSDKKRIADGIDLLVCPEIGKCDIRHLRFDEIPDSV